MCDVQGWSYGLTGKLAKAPKFDSVEGFDKSQYGLFRVHLKVDERGFIWVNLDAAEVPEVSWEESFQAADLQKRLEAFDMKNYRYDHSWSMDGEYNWKTLIDNYNEVSIEYSEQVFLADFSSCRPSAITAPLLTRALQRSPTWRPTMSGRRKASSSITPKVKATLTMPAATWPRHISSPMPLSP